MCPLTGRVCEGNGAKSQEPTGEKKKRKDEFTFFLSWTGYFNTFFGTKQNVLIAVRFENCLKAGTECLVRFVVLFTYSLIESCL